MEVSSIDVVQTCISHRVSKFSLEWLLYAGDVEGVSNQLLLTVDNLVFFCRLPSLNRALRARLRQTAATASIIHRHHYAQRFKLNAFQAQLFAGRAYPWLHSTPVNASIPKMLEPQQNFHRHPVIQRVLSTTAEVTDDVAKDWARECTFLFLRLRHVSRFLSPTSRQFRPGPRPAVGGAKRISLPRLLQCWLIDRWTSQYISSTWEVSQLEIRQFMAVCRQGGCHCPAPNESVVLASADIWQEVVFDALKSGFKFTAKEMKEGTAYALMGMGPKFLAMQEVVWFSFIYFDDGTMELIGVWLGNRHQSNMTGDSTGTTTLESQSDEDPLHIDGCTVVNWSNRGGFSVDDGVTFHEYVSSYLAHDSRWRHRVESVFEGEIEGTLTPTPTPNQTTLAVTEELLQQSYDAADTALHCHLMCRASRT